MPAAVAGPQGRVGASRNLELRTARGRRVRGGAEVQLLDELTHMSHAALLARRGSHFAVGRALSPRVSALGARKELHALQWRIVTQYPSTIALQAQLARRWGGREVNEGSRRAALTFIQFISRVTSEGGSQVLPGWPPSPTVLRCGCGVERRRFRTWHSYKETVHDRVDPFQPACASRGRRFRRWKQRCSASALQRPAPRRALGRDREARGERA